MLQARFEREDGNIEMDMFWLALKELRGATAIAKTFGMDCHPRIHDAKSPSFTQLKRITYRSDLQTQFQDHAPAALANKAAQRAAKQDLRRPLLKANELSLTMLFS